MGVRASYPTNHALSIAIGFTTGIMMLGSHLVMQAGMRPRRRSINVTPECVWVNIQKTIFRRERTSRRPSISSGRTSADGAHLLAGCLEASRASPHIFASTVGPLGIDRASA